MHKKSDNDKNKITNIILNTTNILSLFGSSCCCYSLSRSFTKQTFIVTSAFLGTSLITSFALMCSRHVSEDKPKVKKKYNSEGD